MRRDTLTGILDHLRAIVELIEAELPRDSGASLDLDTNAHTPPPPTQTTAAALERRGVTLISAREDDALDLALMPVARHIASTHPRCDPLINALKRAQSTQHPVRLDLESATQEEIAALTTLGSQAARAQLIGSYRYRKTPTRQLFARPPKTAAAIAFFTGRWLELAVKDHADQIAAAQGWEVLSNAIVRLQNGDRLELDLVLGGPGGRIVILETKSGPQFAADVPKLARIMTALELRPSDGLLVASALDVRSMTAAASQAGMTPVPLEVVPAVLRQIMDVETAG